MTSYGHFSEFYARDFGWTVKAFVRLGYKEWVQKALDYAFDIYQKYGSIEQTINLKGKSFKNLWFYTYESMIWAENYLYLKIKLLVFGYFYYYNSNRRLIKR